MDYYSFIMVMTGLRGYLIHTVLLVMWMISTVDSSCVSSVNELWAYSNPSTEQFKDSYQKYITSDKGEMCRWLITSSDDEEVVKISFPQFDLQKSSGSKDGDCLEIHDGNSRRATLLAKVCDSSPEEYTSEGRYMFVVYRRGEVEGDRGFTMEYEAVSVLTKAKIIRIAGIVGATLAAIGLTYVIFRATKCCSCLRGKSSNNRSSHRNSNTRERDRLTQVVVDDGDNNANAATTSATQNQTADGANNGTSNGNGTASNDATHESDTDSLQDMNEPPPSYESLYLNEQGESVTPPRYSPPQHRTGHPPRRANTVN